MTRYRAVVLVSSFVLIAAVAALAGDNLAGDWQGTSLCQQKNTACRDEKVVYHISAPDPAGNLTVSADKIVNGQPQNMGDIHFHYDKSKSTLDANDEGRIWHFQIKGNEMEGTLESNGKLVRKVSLRKS